MPLEFRQKKYGQIDIEVLMKWISASELTSLPSLPSVISSIHRRAKKQNWLFRKKQGGKGVAYEFLVSSLPLSVQQELREQYLRQIIGKRGVDLASPVIGRKSTTNKVSPLEAYRGSPQLMVERLNALTENQRKVADARIAIVSEVLKVAQQPGFSCAKAIRFIVDNLARSQLDE
ncbi:DNA-binding protein, partial [Escherichia coli]